MDAAWTVRKRFGGGLRQSGIIAAGALFGLEHHRDRLVEDHANATRFANAVAAAPAAHVVPPDTNIVMIDLPAPSDRGGRRPRRGRARSLVSVWTATRIRVVTHLDVDTRLERRRGRADDPCREVLERG